jgi:hypothetical protein
MRSRRTSGAGASGLTEATRPSSGKRGGSEDILDRVVPHFERFPLLSGKRYDFERFASICRLMAGGAHRRRDGLTRIVELASGMNPSGRRRYDAEAVLAALRDKVKG